MRAPAGRAGCASIGAAVVGATVGTGAVAATVLLQVQKAARKQHVRPPSSCARASRWTPRACMQNCTHSLPRSVQARHCTAVKELQPLYL